MAATPERAAADADGSGFPASPSSLTPTQRIVVVTSLLKDGERHLLRHDRAERVADAEPRDVRAASEDQPPAESAVPAHSGPACS